MIHILTFVLLDIHFRLNRLSCSLSIVLKTLIIFSQAERARKLAENERNENSDRLHELAQQVQALQNAKRKVEGDFHSLQEEIDELDNEARAAEDRANKALAEVNNLFCELEIHR